MVTGSFVSSLMMMSRFFKECASTGEDHALVDKVGGNFRRSVFEHVFNGVYDGADGFV